SLTAGPDSLVAMLGAALWMCCAWVLAEEYPIMALIAAWSCAILAVETRRVGAPLLVDALLVTPLSLTRKSSYRWAIAVCAAIALLATVVAYLVAPQALGEI